MNFDSDNARQWRILITVWIVSFVTLWMSAESPEFLRVLGVSIAIGLLYYVIASLASWSVFRIWGPVEEGSRAEFLQSVLVVILSILVLAGLFALAEQVTPWFRPELSVILYALMVQFALFVQGWAFLDRSE